MNLEFTVPAQADLRKITLWISEENPVRAKTFVQELRKAIERIVQFPEAHTAVGTLEGHSVKRKVYGNYLIFYRVMGQTVEILRILHGAQDYSDLF